MKFTLTRTKTQGSGGFINLNKYIFYQTPTEFTGKKNRRPGAQNCPRNSLYFVVIHEK